MIVPSFPENEQARLAALYAFEIVTSNIEKYTTFSRG